METIAEPDRIREDIVQVKVATHDSEMCYATFKGPASFSKGWPGLERSDYPGGVSHKKSWETLPCRPEAA